MERTYKIDLFEGHLIFKADNKEILVDTGSPMTIANCPTLSFMDREFHCTTGFAGKSVDSIAEMVGHPFDVLMGTDVMARFYIKIDYKNREIAFSDEALPTADFASLPIRDIGMGMLSVALTVAGSRLNFALDTGAKISYIDARYTQSMASVAQLDDFNPLIGRFSTPIYEMKAQAASLTFAVRFGNLPGMFMTALTMVGINGIIGFDLFNAFTAILDLKAMQLYLK
jgi:hypothetical protein